MARQYMAMMKLGFMPNAWKNVATVIFRTAPAASSTAMRMRSCVVRPCFSWTLVATVRFTVAVDFRTLVSFLSVVAGPPLAAACRFVSNHPKSSCASKKACPSQPLAEFQRTGLSTCGATFAWPQRDPLVNMPSHALPLTRAHGPDTRPRACASAFPLSLGDPFTTWRPTVLSATTALCECPDGLTFASTVSSYSIVGVL